VKVPVWAYDLACAFWARAGAQPSFPRELEGAFESAFDVTVKRLPALTLGSIRAWLAPLGIVVQAKGDRALCGCLAAAHGSAFVFIDSDDSVDEQRYTLAHELAHYLRDIWQPRQHAERILGSAATKVCDGDRAPTMDQRLAAALDGISLAFHVHLWERGPDGQPASEAIEDHENCADILALELLVPAAHLGQRGAGAWSEDELLDRLMNDYGLPRREARRYASRLRPQPERPERWLEELRAAL
jgi:hypothetical protein